MAEYIERKAVLDYIDHMPSELTRDGRRMIRRIRLTEYISDSIPAADVVPVRHGRWKPYDLTWGRSVYACTACEEAFDVPTEMGKPIYAYCPNCGARMDGDRECD